MCQTLSGVVVDKLTGPNVYIHRTSDSHNVIMDYFRIRDTRVGVVCPMEYSPEYGDPFNLEGYKLRFDDVRPDWWTEEKRESVESQFRETMRGILDEVDRTGRWNRDLVGVGIKSLGNIKHIDGNLQIERGEFKTLSNLRFVCGEIYLTRTKLKTLGNLIGVGEGLRLYGASELRSLGKLVSVGRDLRIDGLTGRLKTFGRLKYVGRSINTYGVEPKGREKVTVIGN